MIHLGAALVAAALLGAFHALAMRVADRHVLASQALWSEPIVLGAGVAAALCCSFLAITLPELVGMVVLVCGLSICVVTDLRFGYVFDVVSIPAMAVLLVCAYFEGALLPMAEGGATCAGIILVLYAVSRGRGIGLGDLKLAACIGLALGVFGGIIAIAASFVAGAIHGTILLLTRRAGRGDSMRFAPYLALGSMISVAMSWYGS